jgi:hypothetical protein
MYHWPQACTKRVGNVLAERIRQVRSVGNAAALQQVINRMADEGKQPEQEYANRAEVLAAMIRQATPGVVAALQQVVNQVPTRIQSVKSVSSEIVKDFKALEAG